MSGAKEYWARVKPEFVDGDEARWIEFSDELVAGSQRIEEWGPHGPVEWGDTKLFWDDTQRRDERGVGMFEDCDYASWPEDMIEIVEIGWDDDGERYAVEGGERMELLEHPPEPVVVARLGRVELATVLAALRFWQRCGLGDGSRDLVDGLPLHETGIATDDGSFEAMAGDEIDALCERMNTGGA